VKRTELALVGAPPSDTLRLELHGAVGEDGLILEFLHDERQTGTLARVLDGRIGLGELSVPVAVKLQRDSALSQEDRGSVAAKFDKEHNVHRRLQDSSQPGNGQERIVRQLEVWSGPAGQEADSLEPSILCGRARHALTPRCPECDDPEAVLEELQLTDDRGLRCSRCHRQFWPTPKTRDAIVEATLRRDPACQGCPQEHSPDIEGCRSSAFFLSFFRNRVLLLERLDIDLDDYLRWKRDAGLSGARQATRQRFDAHRSLVEEQRAQLQGASLAKIADLMSAADLFSEILAGVEHLHGHGIAHLDLKPANVCLRFRGADVDVKVIDLGLSDDPDTLAYLRQAEGPLSLWTDYSAPEFRRPRGRALQVDGRFQDDVCELDWPCPETPSLDGPCVGDELFFDDRELAQHRYRILNVRPGRDGLMVVQARAEPHHRLWLGEAQALPPFGPDACTRSGLAVALGKHCGFPADIYSLGMLLLALLVGQPDVGDFREALPGVQIELEEQLRGQPLLPSRALVHQLLGEPSKHLHVFHSYAHRLAKFGVAQPLAEELLGLVLRAVLRGDTGVFYLADRGADARPALRRFRTDLDAVRNALHNALSAAQAAGIQEARLAALDQFRGRLQGRSSAIKPTPRQDAEQRLLYPALDLGMAGEDYRKNELAYLPASSAPASILDRWEREIRLAGKRSAAGRSWDFLIHYCRRVELIPELSAQFLERFHALAETVKEPNRCTEDSQKEEQDRVRFWVDEFQALAERLQYGHQFVEEFQAFLSTLKDRFLTPWDRALKVKKLVFFRRSAVHLPLSRSERSAIPDREMATAIDRLESFVAKSEAVSEQRARHFETALARWRDWHADRSWLDALQHLETDAIRQRQQVETECVEWNKGWKAAQRDLRACLSGIQGVLGSYAPLLSPQGGPEEIAARITRAQRQAINLESARAAANWLRENWPAPSERLEALYAMWELGMVAS
jgi:serine/threonine protein kinase